jgi:hypothetical protein
MIFSPHRERRKNMTNKKIGMMGANLIACLGLIGLAGANIAEKPLSFKAADATSKSVTFGSGKNYLTGGAATVLDSGSLNQGSSVVTAYGGDLIGSASYGQSGSDALAKLTSVRKTGGEYDDVIQWHLIIGLKNITRVDVVYAMSPSAGGNLYDRCKLVAYTDSNASGKNVEADDEGNQPTTALPANQTSVSYVPSAAGKELNGSANSIKLTVDLSVSNGPLTTYTGTFVLTSITLTWSC